MYEIQNSTLIYNTHAPVKCDANRSTDRSIRTDISIIYVVTTLRNRNRGAEPGSDNSLICGPSS